MPKFNTIKEQILSLQQSEDTGIEYNQERLEADIEKYESENSSLIIKVITIIGAFIGSGFLLTFFFVVKIFHEPLSMIILGLGLIITSIALSNKGKLLLFETSFIAFLIYGGLLLGLGLNEFKINPSLSSVYFFTVGLLIFLFSKNEIQILLGVIVPLTSVIWFIHFQNLFFLFHIYNFLLTIGLVYLYFKEAQFITNPFFTRRYTALKSGFIIVFLMGMATVSLKELSINENYFNWVSAIGPILAIGYILGKVLEKIAVHKKSTIVLIQTISVLVLLATIIFPAISASIVVILLCFYINYKTGLIIGILSLVYFICQFYYELNFTLLVKSELLLATGLLFSCMYFFSSKKLSVSGEI